MFQANGFYNANGAARFIPAAYTLFEKQFYERVQKRGDMNRVRIHEYSRQGWTFHAKVR